MGVRNEGQQQRPLATVVFILAGSGGVGKSSSARMLAQAAGLAGKRVTLVDGNPGQQSQRAYLDAGDRHALELVFDMGLPGALASPRDVDAAFAFLAGPADPYADDVNDMYVEALTALRRYCDLIIVDADRTDPTLWADGRSFSGGVVRPMVGQDAARILFRIGQSGSQVDDGLAALDAINMPERTGVVAQCPVNVKPLPDRRWRDMLRGLGEWVGYDRWSQESLRMIERKQRGYTKGREPKWVVDALAWSGVHITGSSTSKRKRGGRR